MSLLDRFRRKREQRSTDATATYWRVLQLAAQGDEKADSDAAARDLEAAASAIGRGDDEVEADLEALRELLALNPATLAADRAHVMARKDAVEAEIVEAGRALDRASDYLHVTLEAKRSSMSSDLMKQNERADRIATLRAYLNGRGAPRSEGGPMTAYTLAQFEGAADAGRADYLALTDMESCRKAAQLMLQKDPAAAAEFGAATDERAVERAAAYLHRCVAARSAKTQREQVAAPCAPEHLASLRLAELDRLSPDLKAVLADEAVALRVARAVLAHDTAAAAEFTREGDRDGAAPARLAACLVADQRRKASQR